MGHNGAAATWYGRHGAHAPLAHAAMRWRESGIDDAAAAVRDLRTHLVGVYVEFFDAYAPAVALALTGLAEEAPFAYKDVQAVVDVVVRAGLADPVAELAPIGVVKG